MERKPLGSVSSKVTRKRSRPSNATTSQDQTKRRRVTRSMQRKTCADFEMKENSRTSAESGTMYSTTSSSNSNSSQELTITLNPALAQQQRQSRFQPAPAPPLPTTQLACKENIVEPSDIYASMSLRPRPPLQHQQQQQQLQMYGFRPVPALEVDMECLSEGFLETLVVKTPTPHQQTHFLSSGHTHARTKPGKLNFLTPPLDVLENSSNSSPLPQLQWARSAALWRTMRSKDVSKVTPEAELRMRHPEILSSMRIILLDWMMEVCEEYKLHRETYYLAMDMFDRFMDAREDIHKEQLQLLGVTCLFIASKIEEIYPPKAADFAYVTDGACSVGDLLDTELIICKVLDWRLNHGIVTVNTWVNTYMQLCSHHFRPPGGKTKEFDLPAYSTVEFPKVMKLLDLCCLDVASRQFGSSVLAASAVYHQSERCRLHLNKITGYDLQDIQLCVNWMHPFAVILSQKPSTTKKNFSGVTPQDKHNIQTHDVSITMLEDAVELRRTQETTPTQYALLQDCSVMMTPPRSAERRCLAPINLPC